MTVSYAHESNDSLSSRQVHEAEEAANESRRLAEIEAIVKQRIADAVSESRNVITSRTVQLVMVMKELPRLYTVASSEEESSVVAEATAALESSDQSQVETAVGLFLAGQGNCEHAYSALTPH
jgi:hypothetical protein